jgi:protoheme IX farnesyltransferase
LSAWQILVLGVGTLLASGAAGAFNQLWERDMDRDMRRTRERPFASGRFEATRIWYVGIALVLLISIAATALATNVTAALYIFLGAFTYGVVYTVWLKRRTWLNIVIGGLAGSFAVLTGAAAADPTPGALPLLLALVLFLWTPSHFWSLAIANRDDYAAAGIPMLPVVVGTARAARIVHANTWLLVAASLLPAFFGAGPAYLICAVLGGLWFLRHTRALARDPQRRTAMKAFFASMAQLSMVIVGVTLDAALH